ncbi:MAG TPA: hypothetical protein VHC40_05605 [Rhizomicrobium sp.]|nr:hypothetical protein [Rhizomicrobium sp.]
MRENPQTSADTVPCDYVDVTRSDAAGQPHFRFQPHRRGGAPGTPAFDMEIEGARALWQHLGKLIQEGKSA